MADHPSEGAFGDSQGSEHSNRFSRRKVMLGIGALLVIVVICVAAIVIMLQRIEARNATFQPPMTALERQRLLPQDPVLDTVPRLDGLRYRDRAERASADFSPAQDDLQDQSPTLSHTLMLHSDDLSADARSNVHTAHSAP